MTTQIRHSNRSGLVRGIAALIAVLLTISLGCQGKTDTPRGFSSVVPVSVTTVIRKDVPDVLTTVGHIEAWSTVTIKSRVAGELQRIAIVEGQLVKKGDLLFQIDPRPAIAALNEAKARLERDRILLKKAEEDVTRYVDLVAKDYVTQEQFQAVTTNAEALKATIMADEATVANASLNVNFCAIRSPLDGRTGQILADEGMQVKANDDKGMVVINQIKPVFATFSVPERYLPRLREAGIVMNLSVVVSGPALGDRTLTGELVFIDNAVMQSTGTVLLKARFENEDEALLPGQYVQVKLSLDIQKDRLVLPARAVQSGQQGTYVFVIDESQKAVFRPVQVGLEFGDELVVEGGLSAGERIVIDGQIRLIDGATVSIREPETNHAVPSDAVDADREKTDQPELPSSLTAATPLETAAPEETPNR